MKIETKALTLSWYTSTMLIQKLLSTIKYLPKQIKPLLPEPQLSDFYHQLQGPKNGELLFVTVGTDLAACDFYKYLK